jgi:hypothetical protein
MKIRRIRAALSHTDRQKDGRTDMHDAANRRFRNFAKPLKTKINSPISGGGQK